MSFSDYATSVIRTVVPALWGTALAWLVSVGLLDQAAADGPGAAVGGFLVTICVAGFYMLARAIEPKLPQWIAALLMGSPAAPKYLGSVPVGGTEVDPYGAQHRL
jgi:hypothetical protein